MNDWITFGLGVFAGAFALLINLGAAGELGYQAWQKAAAKHCAHIDSRAEYNKCVEEFVK